MCSSLIALSSQIKDLKENSNGNGKSPLFTKFIEHFLMC